MIDNSEKNDRRNYRRAFCDMVAGRKPSFPLADLGGRVASVCAPVYPEIKGFLGVRGNRENETVTLLNTIGEHNEAVLNRLGIGFRRLYVKPPGTWSLAVNPDNSFADEWGILHKPRGPYVERISHPLGSASLKDLDSFHWPDTKDPGRYSGLAERAISLYRKTDFIICAGHISAGIFQDCWNLRGMERFLMDMAMDVEFAHALLRRVTDYHLGIWREVLTRIGPVVDIVETADDLGTQDGLLISPEMYRRMIKPYYEELHRTIRKYSNARIFFHSCGAVMPLIDDLIDTGVNILNPIQPLPGLMEPEELGERYSDRLLFHGGLDVQRLLIDGSREDVRNQVRRYYRALGKERYIMAPANSVQPGTRIENLIEAYDTLGDLA